MVIKVKLYGDLRKKEPQQNSFEGAPSTMNIEDDGIETIFDILKKFSIEETEISHIFVNHKYSGPGKEVRDGDRVGLFPRNMALIFEEIVRNNSILITIKLFSDLQKYRPAQSEIELPEGSTINSIREKYKISTKSKKFIIMVNGRPCYEDDFVVKDGDNVSISSPIDEN